MTLRNSSGVFRQLIDETEGKHITKRQKVEGKTVAWRFDMVALDEDHGDTRFRGFEPVVSNILAHSSILNDGCYTSSCTFSPSVINIA